MACQGEERSAKEHKAPEQKATRLLPKEGAIVSFSFKGEGGKTLWGAKLCVPPRVKELSAYIPHRRNSKNFKNVRNVKNVKSVNQICALWLVVGSEKKVIGWRPEVTTSGGESQLRNESSHLRMMSFLSLFIGRKENGRRWLAQAQEVPTSGWESQWESHRKCQLPVDYIISKPGDWLKRPGRWGLANRSDQERMEVKGD